MCHCHSQSQCLFSIQLHIFCLILIAYILLVVVHRGRTGFQHNCFWWTTQFWFIFHFFVSKKKEGASFHTRHSFWCSFWTSAGHSGWRLNTLTRCHIIGRSDICIVELVYQIKWPINAPKVEVCLSDILSVLLAVLSFEAHILSLSYTHVVTRQTFITPKSPLSL